MLRSSSENCVATSTPACCNTWPDDECEKPGGIAAKATRLDRVKTALGAPDLTVPVDALAADSNVLFIIEKRLCHDDV